jgi:hypothetical protein
MHPQEPTYLRCSTRVDSDLTHSIWPDWKVLLVANTLAYFRTVAATNKESLITLTPERERSPKERDLCKGEGGTEEKGDGRKVSLIKTDLKLCLHCRGLYAKTPAISLSLLTLAYGHKLKQSYLCRVAQGGQGMLNKCRCCQHYHRRYRVTLPV